MRPSFLSGNSELHLIANRAIKKGEELSMAWVDVAQHDGESVEECRRRRRYELARGWKFKCECERCAAEAPAPGSVSAEEDIDVVKDESRVEESVERVESGQAGMGPNQID